MSYKMGWAGAAAFQAFDGDKELVFDLADGVSVPPEFKEDDEIGIDVHSDHPANIEMGMNAGFYEVTHLKSGKKFKVLHKTSDWRFDRRCDSCDLTISKSGENFVYKKPGVVVPTKLREYHILRQAYESKICPLCGKAMKEIIS
jgi:hypothetical protein